MGNRAALAVRKMFPGAYGYRVATPRTPQPQQQRRPQQVGKVWGNDFAAMEWISASGRPVSSSQVNPPDPNIAMGRALYPGGSDGRFHYLLAFDDAGEQQAWVDKYDAVLANLLDRWEVPGIKQASIGTDYLNLFPYSVQYVSASQSRVVVIMDQWDSSVVDPITGGDGHNIIVTVFDTSGTVLNQHTIYTTTAGGDEGAIEGTTGSFCDGVNVYFWHSDTTDGAVARVNLASGVWDDLFNRAAIDFSYPDNPIDFRGLVAVDDTGTGDLICVGDDIARVTQAATVVWETNNPDTPHVAFYSSCARSGRSSVWAGGPSEDYGASASRIAHEFTYGGVFVQASAWNPEPVHQAWLLNQ